MYYSVFYTCYVLQNISLKSQTVLLELANPSRPPLMKIGNKRLSDMIKFELTEESKIKGKWMCAEADSVWRDFVFT